VGVVVREHNIYGIPCKYYTTWNTKSNPNTNSVFLYHVELLEIFVISLLCRIECMECSDDW